LRREFRKKFKEKEEKNRKRIKGEIKNITTEAQIWKFVNLGKTSQDNRREQKYGRLGKAFSRIIGRRDEETGEKRGMEEDQEEELGEKEIEIQLNKIKKSDRG